MNKENPIYAEKILTKVRENLRDLYDDNNEIFDECDLKRMETDDKWIQRYLKRRKGNVELGTAFIAQSLRWRRDVGACRLNDAYFPSEFHHYCGIYSYKEDRNGNLILHVRIRLYYKIPALMDLLKKYTIYQLIKIDENAAKLNKNWILLIDCTGANFMNSDLEMGNFLIGTLRNYFPAGQTCVLIHNIPWIFNTVKNVLFAILPGYIKNLIRSCNDKTITNFISETNLPRYLGGDSEHNYRTIPSNLKSLTDMVNDGQLIMTNAELTQALQYFDKVRQILKNDII